MTRRRIMDAAMEAFDEQGFVNTSIEDIVGRAGYTRGAFYSSFPGKDAVFLALMDEELERRSNALSEILADATPATVLDNLRRWTEQQPESGVARIELIAEFRAYSLRHPSTREQVARRDREVRALFARAIEAQFDAAGIAPPAPVADIALIVHALDAYLQTERAIDPAAVRDGFIVDALGLLFRGAIALGATKPAARAPRKRVAKRQPRGRA